MTDDKERFNRWFSDILRDLEENHPQDAGAVLLMVSFPLLETYLRKKCKIPEHCYHLWMKGEHAVQVTQFFNEICGMFPKLGLPNSRRPEEAQEFWMRWRHALLHSATLKDEGDSLQVTATGEAVEGNSERGFRVNPVKFAKCVREAIASDLPTFLEGARLTVDPYGGTSTRKSPPEMPYQNRFE